MVYGAEAVLPCGIIHDSPRVRMYEEREAKPVKTAESGPVIDFISGVVHRYGVPHNIITDNGTNFAKGALARFCAT